MITCATSSLLRGLGVLLCWADRQCRGSTKRQHAPVNLPAGWFKATESAGTVNIIAWSGHWGSARADGGLNLKCCKVSREETFRS